jgi:hypothetical protein
VVEGYQSGFFLWGEGGTSKTYTIEETLKELGKPYKLTNSRVTGKGLFLLLHNFPDVVHVIEDAESMLEDQTAAGVMRSALWGQVGRNGQQERLVCWKTGKEHSEFVFTGGIILVANCPPDDIPQLRAVKTRICSLRHQPSNEEVAALMREIARKGHKHSTYSLDEQKCLEIADEVIARSRRLEKNLDIRLLINSFQDCIQWENGASESHWLDLLESRMTERATSPGCVRGIRSLQKEEEWDIVRRIEKLPVKERLAVWQKETQKSQAALYRRLAELKINSHFSQFLTD